MGEPDKPQPLSFEDAIHELELVVKKLEAGQLTLQESLVLHQHGQQLSQHCNALLDAAQSQIDSQISLPNDG